MKNFLTRSLYSPTTSGWVSSAAMFLGKKEDNCRPHGTPRSEGVSVGRSAVVRRLSIDRVPTARTESARRRCCVWTKAAAIALRFSTFTSALLLSADLGVDCVAPRAYIFSELYETIGRLDKRCLFGDRRALLTVHARVCGSPLQSLCLTVCCVMRSL